MATTDNKGTTMTIQRHVTVYVPEGTKIGYATEEMARLYSNGRSVESRTIELPLGAFWTGDIITVELHRGGSYSDPDESILTGGGWQPARRVVVEASMIFMDTGKVHGAVRDPNTRAHVQSMLLHAGRVGFPYRHAVLVKETT